MQRGLEHVLRCFGHDLEPGLLREATADAAAVKSLLATGRDDRWDDHVSACAPGARHQRVILLSIWKWMVSNDILNFYDV